MKSKLLTYSVPFLCFLSLIKCNPLVDCFFKLHSETLCYENLGCHKNCNRKPNLSCNDYCEGLNTSKRQFVMDECVNLAGVAVKSLCKCREVTESSGGYQTPQKGLAGLACDGIYAGQLFRGILKTILS